MLIASEGDGRLGRLIEYADFTVVLFAAVVVIVIVLLLARLRSSLTQRAHMHLLLNVIFLLAFSGVAAIYYLTYMALDPVVVRFAVNRRYAEAGFPRASSNEAARLANLTKQRANEMLFPSREFVCVNPGWPVRLLPVALIPGTLIARLLVRRRRVW